MSVATRDGSSTGYLLIGGTNKAGTTSVFRYLADHPQVCAADVKETGFFLEKATTGEAESRARYDAYFDGRRPAQILRVEASTGYLANAMICAPRIRFVLGCPKLMFILRNPVDRLWSYYNFQIGQLELEENLSFETFIELSLSVDLAAENRYPAIAPRHFQALRFGNYADNLRIFFDEFGRQNVLVTLFDDLQSDARAFMQRVARFASVDPAFYDEYRFHTSNKTFSSRIRWLHAAAVTTNRHFESFLNRHGGIKRHLVRVYKAANMRRGEQPLMTPAARERLVEYYAEDLAKLENLLGDPLPAGWKSDGCAD